MPLSQSLPGTTQTDLVTFTIKINGQPVSTRYQVALLLITHEVNRVPAAKLSLYDGDAAAQDFAVSNEETFKPGAEIELLIGYHSDETSLFKGIILRHSLKIRNDRSPMLLLDCRDKAIKMTVARKSKYFYDTSDSTAAGELIDTYGLEHGLEDTAVQHQSLVQYDSTDWDFIMTRMEANGMLCTVTDGKITAKKPSLSGEAVLDAVFGATILEFDADLDARNQYQGLAAYTWDAATQAISQADAEDPALKENGNLGAEELSTVLGIEPYNVLAGEGLTQNELQNLANARLQQARLSRCRGRVRFRGYGGVKPGDVINIGGVGERFNGKVFVSGIRHEVTDGFWKTDVQFGLSNDLFATMPDVHSAPAANTIPAIRGLQTGIVTALENDPEAADRIRVRMPVISDSEDGVWCRVSTLDAGNNRGTFFRPEIGDEVIVGFLNDDPRYPVVLGTMNSAAKPAPLAAADANDEKGYVSRSGMKMIFNDADKSFKLETPAGKKITVSEADNLMQLEDGNGNKITMGTASLSIESAAAMNIKAGADLKIEAANITLAPSASFALSAGGASLKAGGGSAGISAPSVTIEGSGTTTIKGGMVMIN